MNMMRDSVKPMIQYPYVIPWTRGAARKEYLQRLLVVTAAVGIGCFVTVLLLSIFVVC